MQKQLPMVINNDPINLSLVTEYGSAESLMLNICIPILDAKRLGVPVSDQMRMYAESMLHEYIEEKSFSLKDLNREFENQ